MIPLKAILKGGSAFKLLERSWSMVTYLAPKQKRKRTSWVINLSTPSSFSWIFRRQKIRETDATIQRGEVFVVSNLPSCRPVLVDACDEGLCGTVETADGPSSRKKADKSKGLLMDSACVPPSEMEPSKPRAKSSGPIRSPCCTSLWLWIFSGLNQTKLSFAQHKSQHLDKPGARGTATRRCCVCGAIRLTTWTMASQPAELSMRDDESLLDAFEKHCYEYFGGQL